MSSSTVNEFTLYKSISFTFTKINLFCRFIFDLFTANEKVIGLVLPVLHDLTQFFGGEYQFYMTGRQRLIKKLILVYGNSSFSDNDIKTCKKRNSLLGSGTAG